MKKPNDGLAILLGIDSSDEYDEEDAEEVKKAAYMRFRQSLDMGDENIEEQMEALDNYIQVSHG